MSKFIRINRLWMLAVIVALMSASFSALPGAAQAECSDPYIVQRGDTLSGIAARCGTTVAALLQANPQIKNRSIIYVGQRLALSGQTSPTPQPTPTSTPSADLLPVVAMGPSCGLPGTQVRVYGRGMPANSVIDLALGKQGGSASVVGTAKTDAKGSFSTVMTIPGSAGKNDLWVVTATPQGSSGSKQAVSNSFDVVEAVAIETGSTEKYTVQSGDTLRKIAERFETTVAAILALNSKITDPNLIYPGQELRIPVPSEEDVVVLVSPQCGPPGTEISVTASGFEEEQMVRLQLREVGGSVMKTELVKANDKGELSAGLVIPADADPDEHWYVTAVIDATNEERGSSNAFAISQPRNTREPAVYTVKRGDTLSGIAVRYSRWLADVLEANPEITDRNRIYTGQVVVIPSRSQ